VSRPREWKRLLRLNESRRQTEEQVDEELEFLHANLIERLTARGLSRPEAEEQARERLAEVRSSRGELIDRGEQTARNHRRRFRRDGLRHDLRMGLRQFRRQPGFSALIVLTLALGIGAGTAVFTILNAFLLAPLPFRDPDQLVDVNETALNVGIERMNVAYPDYLDWKRENRVFAGLAAWDLGEVPVIGDGDPERLRTALVSVDFFSVLGVKPQLGRTFAEGEGIAGTPPVAVIGSGLWKRRYGADPDLVGRSIVLQGRSRTVVGVMPDGFRFPDNVDLWLPETLTAAQTARDDYSHEVVGRLRPGITAAEALRDIERIEAGIAAEIDYKSNIGVTVTPLRALYTRDIRPAVLLAFGAVVSLVLIACANVANLLLARSTIRRREIAVRSSLGAHRRHLIRQLLVESLVLAMFGGSIGLVLGIGGRSLLTAIIPIDVPFWVSFTIDARVLCFTLGISVLTGLLFGLAPALRGTRFSLVEVLKEGGRTGTSGARGHRLQDMLVVAEVTLALVLLISAGLLMQGLRNLNTIDPGYETENIISMRVALPAEEYAEREQRVQFFERVCERIEAQPGVVSAAVVSNLPIGGELWGVSYTVEGAPGNEPGQIPVTNLFVVSPGYRETLGIDLRQGRDFTISEDRGGRDLTALVSEVMAERWWPGEDPLGRRFKFGDETSDFPWVTVVGVVRNIRKASLRAEDRESVYMPLRQLAQLEMHVIVRTETDPRSLAGAMQSAVWEMEPNLPVDNVWTMKGLVSDSIWQSRLTSWVVTLFSVLALVMTATGLFGMISYHVSRRTHEIGLRLALGASRATVVRSVLGRSLGLVAVGLAMGIALSLGTTHLLTGLIYGISSTDPATFAGTIVLMIAIALVAGYLPTLRAARIAPVIALRRE